TLTCMDTELYGPEQLRPKQQDPKVFVLRDESLHVPLALSAGISAIAEMARMASPPAAAS
nr:hypothetical protein [Actinomycetota bacterium]